LPVKLFLALVLFSFSLFADAADDLYEAVRDGNIEKVKTLIKAKAPLNGREGKDSLPLSPLMIAANDNNYDIVKLLVDAGADLNKKNKENGKTALMYSSSNGHIETVKLLLQKPGLLINAKDKEGKTALLHAVFYARKEIVALLIDNKANVNARTNVDESALNIAIKGGRGEIISMLRQAGARE
jgi:ankyrin repeat protein